MSNPTRRMFVITMVAGGGALAVAGAPAKAAAPTLSEADPQALALGYKADNTQVDKTQYPQHAAGQMCGECNFFQGKPGDTAGPCQIFSGKVVSAKGWCSAFSKRV